MSIKIKYFLFIISLHLVITFLVYQLLKDNKILFILSEVLILFSLYICWAIYQAIIRPLDLMKSGTNAIQDEDFNVKYLKTPSKDVNILIDTFNEMMDRLREEKKRTVEQSYFLENLIEATPIGIVILDYDNQISEINPKARTYLQIDQEVTGKSLSEIPHPLAHFISELNTEQKEVIQIGGIDKYRCQVNAVIHKGFKRKFIVIEELTQEILDAEKKAYGKVIRMMAHEVNNSIGAINSLLHTVNEYAFSEDEQFKEYKEALQDAISRNDSLNQFMKNFAKVVRIPPPSLAPENLNDVVSRCVNIMSGIAESHDIIFDLKISDLPIELYIDTSQIEQVIVNIIKNAIEAIHKNGKIIITTSQSSPQLIISDTGHGINSADKDKLFSPFYSTKAEGQGVGLMMIKEILNNHQAQFSLETDHDEGMTSFSITFLGG